MQVIRCGNKLCCLKKNQNIKTWMRVLTYQVGQSLGVEDRLGSHKEQGA